MLTYEEGMALVESFQNNVLQEMEVSEDGGVTADEVGQKMGVDGDLLTHITDRMTSGVPLLVALKGISMPDAIQHSVGAALCIGILMGQAKVPDSAMPDIDNVLEEDNDNE